MWSINEDASITLKKGQTLQKGQCQAKNFGFQKNNKILDCAISQYFFVFKEKINDHNIIRNNAE